MKPRRTTLGQVADAAGVSIATVSKVLNNRGDVSVETRRRVEKHLRASSYRRVGASSAQAQRPSQQIEVVLGGPQNAYAMAVLDGITSSAQLEGFEIVYSPRIEWRTSTESTRRGCWPRSRVGAIFLTMDASGPEFKKLCEADFPVVVVDPLRIAGTHCISIGATNFTGAVTATEHLLSLGHRRIGHAGGPASVECSEARLSGYASALRREGLPLEDSLVTHVPFDYEAGLKAGQRPAGPGRSADGRVRGERRDRARRHRGGPPSRSPGAAGPERRGFRRHLPRRPRNAAADHRRPAAHRDGPARRPIARPGHRERPDRHEPHRAGHPAGRARFRIPVGFA